MRDLNGDNNGIIIDKSTNITVTNDIECEYNQIQKEETTLKNIVKEKVIEVIIGIVLTGISVILEKCQSRGTFASLENGIRLALMGIVIVLFIFGIGILFIAIYDGIKMLTLYHAGSFVEMESKYEWLGKLGEIFQKSENIVQKEERKTGKIYMNFDGKIYRIISMKCPICETEPIGNMYLIYSNKLHKYFWKCSENQAHKVEFDYKKKI